MRRGAQDILLGLRLGEYDEGVNRQVVSQICSDDSEARALDVLWAFAALEAADWPGSAKYFRLLIQIYPDLWVSQLQSLPETERAVTAVQTLRALGLPAPPAIGRVAELAREELRRRGYVIEGEADV